MPRKSSKRRKPRRSSRRRRRSSKRRKPRRSSRRRKPRTSSRRRKPSSRRRFKMHSWPRWPGGGPPRGGLKRRKGDRPKRKAGATRSQRRKLAAEKKMLEKWKAWKYNQLVRQVQQEERMRLDREREAWRAASSIQALTRGRQTRGGKAGRALREEKDRKRLMKLQRLFNDWFCTAYPEKCGGGGGGGKKAAYGFGNKFKMQNYKYSSKDFRRGDKFEKIEWIDPSKYYPKNCAVMDKKNKLSPWYPKVATVYPKYMRVLTHIQKRKRASDISVFTNIKYDQIKKIIWKGGGTESERNKKERREFARKILTKNTKIPSPVINELVDKYLFNEGIQQKKFNKDDFEVGQIVEIERNDGWKGMKGPIEDISEIGIYIRNKNGILEQINYHQISNIKHKKKPKSATKYQMNGGKWTEWEELRNSEDFWVGQLVRIVPFNGTFGPWSQGYIKEIDKNIIHLESSKNKVTVKIKIKKIYMYKYFIPKRKPVKSAAKTKFKMDNTNFIIKKITDLYHPGHAWRYFNENDFNVGQIIDIREKYRDWSGCKYKILDINSTNLWITVVGSGGINRSFNYGSIYSVKYYNEKKNPKSAAKKGQVKKKRRSPKKKK